MASTTALVLGAGGGLGKAMVQQFLADPSISRVVAVSRNGCPADVADARLDWLVSDYSEQSMTSVVAQLTPFKGTVTRVCLCHGLLHSESVWPEKRLEDITADALHEVFHANTVVPGLWLKHLHSLLKGALPCAVAVLSARVGSIGDNRLGGWYAYRTSKSALNMMLQTTAVEYSRRVKNVKLISFHPGTTDTALSKPFQAAVPTDKLFTTEFVAGRLATIMASAEPDGQLVYLDWDNKTIPW